MDNLALIPKPVSLEFMGGSVKRAMVLENTQLVEEPAGERGAEAYQLTISPEGAVVRGTAAGLRFGQVTLRQILEQCAEDIPCLHIVDEPRFGHRGVMLDVSRHFMPLADVKNLLDELAALKFNTFHWHLTDDQGWRLEIRRYPRLTEVGGQRRRTLRGKAGREPQEFNEVPHGGFYTQDEVRELVAYAAARGITVIPEIDLPGHTQAMQAAYPELSCAGQPLEVWDQWGINYEVLCARESTFTFLEGVLEEVLELFPSRVIHLGGDEVETDHWATCPDCSAVMRQQGYADVKQLNGYFVKRVAEFLAGRGARVIGWDELTEVNLPAGVTIMSWRGFEGGMNAARKGLPVIMAPQSHVYLDYAQGPQDSEPLAIGNLTIPLELTYAFEPLPPDLTPDEAKHIVGGQANLWREYIPTTEHAQYMLFPRLHAVAEVLWSPAPQRNWADFRERLPVVLRGLAARGVNFRPLDPAETA